VYVRLRRRDPPKFHLNVRVDEQRVRQRNTELVAAIATGAADVRHRVDEPLMAVDLRIVVSGKNTRTARMVRVRVGVDDALARGADSRPRP